MVVSNKSPPSKSQNGHTKGFLSPYLTGLTNWWLGAKNCQEAFCLSHTAFLKIGNNFQLIRGFHVNSRSPRMGDTGRAPPTWWQLPSWAVAEEWLSPAAWAGALQFITSLLHSFVPSWPQGMFVCHGISPCLLPLQMLFFFLKLNYSCIETLVIKYIQPVFSFNIFFGLYCLPEFVSPKRLNLFHRAEPRSPWPHTLLVLGDQWSALWHSRSQKHPEGDLQRENVPLSAK